MAEIRTLSFFVRGEFKDGLLLVKRQYEKGADIISILANISQYAREHTKTKKDKISLFKYLVLYLKHLTILEKDEVSFGEVDILTEDGEEAIDPELFEFMKEMIEEE